MAPSQETQSTISTGFEAITDSGTSEKPTGRYKWRTALTGSLGTRLINRHRHSRTSLPLPDTSEPIEDIASRVTCVA